MITKKTIALLCLFLISFCACKKDNESLVADAIVKNTGDPAADGCGWLIQIGSGNTLYKAENLPEKFQKDNLPIHIRYKVIGTRYYCGMLPAPQNQGMPTIHLNGIEEN